MSKSKLNQLIENKHFHHVFQPIVDLRTKEIIGFEALLRSDLFERPEQAFLSADEGKERYKLDQLSITMAINHFSKYCDSNLPLYINVFPSTVARSNFIPFLNDVVNESKLNHYQLVIELVELEVIKELEPLKWNIQQLKENGYIISIDDVGKGSSTFRLMIELEPHIIKMGQYFVKELPHSTLNQKMIESLQDYCLNMGMTLILEGIETEKELQAVKQLGVTHGQGFYLGEPAWLEQVSNYLSGS
ncbi:EAL domain-containing protein [Alkalibacillus silvisoli]|uniref:EAL domain-containing protein n=1 Tax=Alkalibacillus silvisoli TaxID=392823 RepID=A0ABP3K006_9BACI